MTPRFLTAIPYILQHEGGQTITNIKEDGGGTTKFGISLNLIESLHLDENHDGVVDSKDIITLTLAEAEDIYYNNFWRPSYETFPINVAIKVFDTAVNAGVGRANMFLQQSLNNLGSKLNIDGLLGQQTTTEVSKYTEAQIIKEYCTIQGNFYKNIVAKNPQKSIFLNGWLTRANWSTNI